MIMLEKLNFYPLCIEWGLNKSVTKWFIESFNYI